MVERAGAIKARSRQIFEKTMMGIQRAFQVPTDKQKNSWFIIVDVKNR
jgi:hypothetical protein